jgi:hypothetical protein
MNIDITSRVSTLIYKPKIESDDFGVHHTPLIETFDVTPIINEIGIDFAIVILPSIRSDETCPECFGGKLPDRGRIHFRILGVLPLLVLYFGFYIAFDPVIADRAFERLVSRLLAWCCGTNQEFRKRVPKNSQFSFGSLDFSSTVASRFLT